MRKTILDILLSFFRRFAFENQFTNLPFTTLGTVIADPILKLGSDEIPVEELVRSFNLQLSTFNL